jgi:uncharacterized protein HemY
MSMVNILILIIVILLILLLIFILAILILASDFNFRDYYSELEEKVTKKHIQKKRNKSQ